MFPTRLAHALRTCTVSSSSKPIITKGNFLSQSSFLVRNTNFGSEISLSRRMSSGGSKPKVFLTRPDIPKAALKLLQDKFDLTLWNEPRPVPRDYLLKSVPGIDGLYCLITDKIDKELLDAAGPNLKVIGTMSVGHDHIDLGEVKKRGIQVGFTPNVLTNATAETTVAVLLAASRRMFEAREELLNGGWAKAAWGPEYLCGQELTGSTVGIYGMGRIGQAVMKRLKAFDVGRFIYSGRSKKDDVADAQFVDFDTFCKESDFVIVTCALTPETKEIFNEKAFSLMKPNTVFVNTSRGGTVDQDALIRALKENKIFSAGLDVMTPEPLPTDHELTKLRNCVVVPHIGSATYKARTDMAVTTSKNIIAALEGSPMPAKLC